MALPAIAVLGFWIVIQLISGLGSLAVTTESGGVAYMAHVGGFVAGARAGQAVGGQAPRDRLSLARQALISGCRLGARLSNAFTGSS